MNQEIRNVLPDPTNLEKMEAIKKAFEARYGVDEGSRTKKQWCDLVAAYGLEVVVKRSAFSRGQIRRRMGK